MVCGLLEPDAGAVEVAGAPLTTRSVAAKAAIGYVPQDLAIYPDLSAAENLRFFARLYGIPSAKARERVTEVLDVVGLAERGDDQAKTYSGGMKRRLNIGIGLLHRPRLLVLDEPTVGVDPQSRNAILESVERLAAEGMAVLYTTHYMEEAERLCDRIGIVDLGELKAEGTRGELVALVGQHDRVQLQGSGDLEAGARACGDARGGRRRERARRRARADRRPRARRARGAAPDGHRRRRRRRRRRGGRARSRGGLPPPHRQGAQGLVCTPPS